MGLVRLRPTSCALHGTATALHSHGHSGGWVGLGFQGFRVSGFQGFRVSGFQGFRVSGFQVYGFRV